MTTIIGIDPDVTASGVAIYSGTYTLATMPLFNLMEYLGKAKNELQIKVGISAGWLNKKVSFHGNNLPDKVKERIAERVGANHEIGKQIETFCKDKNIPHFLARPRQRKVKSDEFKQLTGYEQRSNQEERDAAMVVWSYLLHV